MSLTTLFRIVLGALTGFFIVLLVIILQVQHLQNDTVTAEERRYRSYRIADELRQSSEDLTRMARSYVCTGDKKFLRYYQAILDIRNGKRPRPRNYGTSYWYLRADKLGQESDQKAIALVDMMAAEGFTDHEFGLLKLSQQRSDHLVEMERQAFSILEEAQKQSGKTLSAAQAHASAILYSDEYHKAKAGIMKPIDHFLREVESRTSHEVGALEQKALRHIRYAIALLGSFIVVVPLMGILARRQIMLPLAKLVERSQEIAEGKYSTDVVPPRGIAELSVLNKGFDDMAKAINHEIAELKKLQDALTTSELNLKKAQQITSIGSWYVDSMEILHLSDQALEILGVAESGGLDYESYMAIVHPEDRNPLRASWKAALKGEPFDIEHRVVIDGAPKWLHSRGEFTVDESGRIQSGVGTIQDINERKLVEMRDKSRRYILELIANGTDVHLVLDTLANDLEDELADSYCCVMMSAANGRQLKVGAAPSLPKDVAAALDGLEIEPGSACCGAAAFTGESVIVEDVRFHPNFQKLRDAMKDAGIRSCWSYPIISASNEVLGTLAIYLKNHCFPGGREQQVLNSFAHLAGIGLSSAISGREVQV